MVKDKLSCIQEQENMKTSNAVDSMKDTTIEATDVEMGFDESNEASLLNSLTHLYANPVIAALREYVANAHDAHVDNGNDFSRPIEVNVNHRFEKQFHLRVRDYGKGMTEQQLTKVYSQYGATTKAKNNAQVGGFGLGSKSGLAVSDEMCVHTVANGIKVEARVLKNSFNKSVIRIEKSSPTTEPSGTTILLPLNQSQTRELREKAALQLVGYHHDHILLDGKKLERSVFDEKLFYPIKLNGQTLAYIEKNHGIDKFKYQYFAVQEVDNRTGVRTVNPNLHIMMGGVYYDVMPTGGSMPTTSAFISMFNEILVRFQNSPNIILNLPIGSVSLPPHRDSIIDTEKTWTSISNLLQNINLALFPTNQKHLNSLEFLEACKEVSNMPNLFVPEQRKWEWRGEQFDNDLHENMKTTPFFLTNFSSYSSRVMQIFSSNTNHLFSLLHSRHNYSASYNSDVETTNYFRANQNYYDNSKKPVAIVEIKIDAAQQQSVEQYYAYSKRTSSWPSGKKKPAAPYVRTIIQRALPTIIKNKLSVDFITVVLTSGEALPKHYQNAVMLSMTVDEMKAEYKKLVPPAPKKVVTHKHALVEESGVSSFTINSENAENVFYFGGRDQYVYAGPKTLAFDELILIKETATSGASRWGGKATWLGKLERILPVGSHPVALSSTRLCASFEKAFPEATSMGSYVMNYYDNLPEDEKTAVQHVYSILENWKNPTRLFEVFREEYDLIENTALKLTLTKPQLASIAAYLFSFKDEYVEGFEAWKERFNHGKNNKVLAGEALLPVSYMLNDSKIYHKAIAGEISNMDTFINNLIRG